MPMSTPQCRDNQWKVQTYGKHIYNQIAKSYREWQWDSLTMVHSVTLSYAHLRCIGTMTKSRTIDSWLLAEGQCFCTRNRTLCGVPEGKTFQHTAQASSY